MICSNASIRRYERGNPHELRQAVFTCLPVPVAAMDAQPGGCVPELGETASSAPASTTGSGAGSHDESGASSPVHLIVTAGPRWLAVAADQIEEIFDDPHVLKIPRTGPGFAGYALHRGLLLPITDLAALVDSLPCDTQRLDAESTSAMSVATAYTDHGRAPAQVLVIRSAARSIGLLISEVMGVCESATILSDVSDPAMDVDDSDHATEDVTQRRGLPAAVLQRLRVDDITAFPGATSCVAAGYRNNLGGIDLPLIDIAALVRSEVFTNAAVAASTSANSAVAAKGSG